MNSRFIHLGSAVLSLGLCVAFLPSASAQVVIANYASQPGFSSAAPIAVGQPRIVGFQPAQRGLSMQTSHAVSSVVPASFPGGIQIVGQTGHIAPQVVSLPQSSFRIAGYGLAPATYAAPTYTSLSSASPIGRSAYRSSIVSSAGTYGRIVRYQYRVPVYGTVTRAATCGSAVSSSSTSLTPQPDPVSQPAEQSEADAAAAHANDASQ